MRRSDPFIGLLLFASAGFLWAVESSTDSVKSQSHSPHVRKEPDEILSENEMAQMLSDLDFFYSMDFAVNLPILENYEVVESTTPLLTEAPK